MKFVLGKDSCVPVASLKDLVSDMLHLLHLQQNNNASLALEALMDPKQRSALMLAAGLAAAERDVQLAQVLHAGWPAVPPLRHVGPHEYAAVKPAAADQG